MAGQTCAGCTTTYTVGAEKCPQCGSTELAETSGGTVLPSVTVACGNNTCRYEGRQRRVMLRTAAPGVVELPRLACAACGLDMPTVAPWPPVTDAEEETMPKITAHGGPSIADTEVVVVGEHEAELDPAAEEPRKSGVGEDVAAESNPEEPSEQPEPEESGTPTQRRSRRRTQSTE